MSALDKQLRRVLHKNTSSRKNLAWLTSSNNNKKNTLSEWGPKNHSERYSFVYYSIGHITPVVTNFRLSYKVLQFVWFFHQFLISQRILALHPAHSKTNSSWTDNNILISSTDINFFFNIIIAIWYIPAKDCRIFIAARSAAARIKNCEDLSLENIFFCQVHFCVASFTSLCSNRLQKLSTPRNLKVLLINSRLRSGSYPRVPKTKEETP